jgi:hypothetical protein
MSTIWTPGGERPVEPSGGEPAPAADEQAELSEEELAARMEELRDQLSKTPAEVVILNHCYGLFELAALHLSLQPPQLEQSQLAIDALGLIVEGLEGRLGEGEQQVREGLSQLRMAFVQIRSEIEGGGAGGGSAEGAQAPTDSGPG